MFIINRGNVKTGLLRKAMKRIAKELKLALKIGFFDSGIGGLSVLHQALKVLPPEEYLFYADSDHVPYGEKTSEEIARYADEAVRFLLQEGAGAIVVACNTATSVAIELLRRKYSVPILGVEPAVKPAVEQSGGGRVLVVATPVTVREKKLRDLIDRVDRRHIVDLQPLPELVRFAERLEFRSDAVTSYLRGAFSDRTLSDYTFLVLGCTHFNYFKDTFREVFPQQTSILDSCAGTVHHLAKILKESGMPESRACSVAYYRSGRKVTEPESLRQMDCLLRRLDKMALL